MPRALLATGLLAVAVATSSGCSCISLEELQDGDATAGRGGASSGGGEALGGASAGGAGNGGAVGAAGSGDGGGGAPQVPPLEACIAADGPVVWFRMSSADATEPNLGSFVGDGAYVGEVTPVPSLVGPSDPAGAKSFGGGALLEYLASQFVGVEQPLTIEIWLQLNEAAQVGGGEKRLFEALRADGSLAVELGLGPRAVPDGQDQLFFRLRESPMVRSVFHNAATYLDEADTPLHVVATYGYAGAADLALWVDGELVASPGGGDALALAPMTTLRVASTLGTDGSARAVVDEVAIYTAVLPAARITAHHAAGTRGAPCD
jgi:hypothetical protein